MRLEQGHSILKGLLDNDNRYRKGLDKDNLCWRGCDKKILFKGNEQQTYKELG